MNFSQLDFCAKLPSSCETSVVLPGLRPWTHVACCACPNTDVWSSTPVGRTYRGSLRSAPIICFVVVLCNQCLLATTFIGLGIILSSPERSIELRQPICSACRSTHAIRLAALDYEADACSPTIVGNETRLWEDAQVSLYQYRTERPFNYPVDNLDPPARRLQAARSCSAR